MRIKDLALMPFEIEVDTNGYTLYKIGIVEAEGPNKGCKKETTWGFYTRHPSSVASMFEKVVFEKVVAEDKKVTLAEFLAIYKDEFKTLRERIDKILSKV